MAWMAGEIVGAYVLDAQLGQGGMATVYKAHHQNLKRDVAIKVMHQNFLDDEGFVTRFKREAEIVANLTHPHIVPVYDFDEHDGQPYLVMKYVPGFTLKKQLIKNPPELEALITIAAAIGDALTYAHERGILHRDVKPSNVIIAPDGTPFLTDFGLARLVSSGESTISADMLLGTPHYISPEQARGLKTLDGRTDVYSLGVILYEMLVGKVPFTGDSAFSIIHDHIYTPLPPPTRANPELPQSVEAVLFKALAKDPHERYATPNEMLAAMQSAIARNDLQSLNPERGKIAEASLADIRAEMENTPTKIVPSGIASPTNTGSGSGRNARIMPKPVPFYNRERFWTISGCGSLLVITFLSFGILLGMVGNMQALAALSVDNDGQMGPVGGLGNLREAAEARALFELYDISVVNNGGIQILDMPEVPLVDLPDEGTNPIVALLRAQAFYTEGTITDARVEVINNAPDDEATRANYFINAAMLAEMGERDVAGTVLFAAIALESAAGIPEIYDAMRPIAGEILYLGAGTLEGDGLTLTIRQLGEEGLLSDEQRDVLLGSPFVNFALSTTLLENENTNAAQALLFRERDSEVFVEEFDYLRGVAQMQAGNEARAIVLWDGILEREGVPDWLTDAINTQTETRTDS